MPEENADRKNASFRKRRPPDPATSRASVVRSLRVNAQQGADEASWKSLKVHADTLPIGSDGRWQANLVVLRAYVQQSDGEYPSRSPLRCAEERKLKDWCDTQRRARRSTVRATLDAARVQLLDLVHGCWGAAGRAESDNEEEEEEEGEGKY